MMNPKAFQAVLRKRARAYGPMLRVCSAPGCSTLTMGGTCVEHDPPVTVTFERGRPLVRKRDVVELGSRHDRS